MSGYREKDWTLWRPADQWSLAFISARIGFGLLPISFGILLTGCPLIFSAMTAVVGAALLIWGLRNY